MIRRLWFVSLAFATLLPTAAFFSVRGWWFAAAALVTGLIWLVGELRRYQRISGACFVILGALNGVAVTTGFLPTLLLLGLVASLCCWDLQRFARRLDLAAWVEQRLQLEQAHLRRLVWVIAAGFLPAALSMLFTIPLPFTLALFLALAGIALLANVGYALRRETVKTDDEQR